MTKTAFFKLLLAIVITFILILPEHFKTPKGHRLELSCLEVCLQPNFNYSLPSLNFSFVTFLKPIRETQTIMGILLNHSNFQNFPRICQGIMNKFQMCSSCLACESTKLMDFISQEQTSKVLIMKGSTEVKTKDFHSPCQHFNFTVAPIADHLEKYNITCNLKTRTRRSASVEEDPNEEKSMNHTCRITEYLDNCTHISLHLEMDVKSHEYKRAAVLLRGKDSEKPPTSALWVISGTKQRVPLTQVKKVLPPIPELEVTSTMHLQDQYTRISL
ncbi:transmembrane protein 156 isoform X5 [Suricata suricatta]|uniref:transmembrane protein 156 isoform X5 n=1 Tax=Suricata suricatta TaxID=37032 RepID=UPI0011558847|nr:transmembrane protein 156 isoform X5 [Suricata suricatta]